MTKSQRYRLKHPERARESTRMAKKRWRAKHAYQDLQANKSRRDALQKSLKDRAGNHYSNWSKAEDAMLWNHSKSELAKMLGRTFHSIAARRRRQRKIQQENPCAVRGVEL